MTTMKLKTQFGFYQDTSRLPYRRKSMHMKPDKFPTLDYQQLLSDLSDSESEVSTKKYHFKFTCCKF